MLTIYTDGSTYPNPGPGGWAFAAYDGERLVAARGAPMVDTTNNRMEMTAIIKAMRWADGRTCRILTDSQLCRDSITRWAPSWRRRGWRKAEGGEPANVDLVREALELYERGGVEIQWVRGHAGLAGNELVDKICGLYRASASGAMDRAAATAQAAALLSA